MTYHSHDLRNGGTGVRDAQFINNTGQDEGNPPATNTMRYPDHQKRHKCGVGEQALGLRKAECLRCHRRGLSG
jgi:hypothetical protein